MTDDLNVVVNDLNNFQQTFSLSFGAVLLHYPFALIQSLAFSILYLYFSIFLSLSLCFLSFVLSLIILCLFLRYSSITCSVLYSFLAFLNFPCLVQFLFPFIFDFLLTPFGALILTLTQLFLGKWENFPIFAPKNEEENCGKASTNNYFN